MRLMSLLAAMAVLFTTSAVAFDQAVDAELGPAVGETIPSADRFTALAGDKGTVIVFVRSVDWCPYCQRQVLEIIENDSAFAAQGLEVVFVSYDSPEKQAKFQKKNKVEATFIADEGSALIDAFGLRNEAHKEGSFAYGIPHPAIFITSPDGVVQAKLYETDYASNKKSYTKRPTVDAIMAAAALAFSS